MGGAARAAPGAPTPCPSARTPWPRRHVPGPRGGSFGREMRGTRLAMIGHMQFALASLCLVIAVSLFFGTLRLGEPSKSGRAKPIA